MIALSTKNHPADHYLETERLLLRCPSEADGPILQTAVHNSIKQLRPWFPWAAERGMTLEESEATVRYAQYRFESGIEFEFYLFLKESGQMIGVCGLCRPERSVPQFELSYWLCAGFENHGYMTEAATAVVDFAFNTVCLKQLELHCEQINVSSLALAKRLGFSEERQVGSELVLTQFNPN